jgi:hypothetical protein
MIDAVIICTARAGLARRGKGHALIETRRGAKYVVLTPCIGGGQGRSGLVCLEEGSRWA